MGFPSPLKYTPQIAKLTQILSIEDLRSFFSLAPPLAGAMYAVTFSVVSVSTKCTSRLGRLC